MENSKLPKVREATLVEKSENPLNSGFTETLALSDFVKPISPHFGANANFNFSNRYMSVKGSFGIGALVFAAWSGCCFCVKKPWIRSLAVASVLGATYAVLDHRDYKRNIITSKREQSDVNKNDAPNNNETKEGSSKPFALKTYSQLNDGIACNPDVWFVEGFVAIGLVNWLLAGAGVGKSIFMVQIAVAVSSGTRIEFLPQDNHIPRKTQVVFYRIEVFANEYSGKYGDGKMLEESGIKWRDRNDLNAPNYQGLIDDLKLMVETISEDTLVCIDPATKLSDFDPGKFAEDAENTMERAKEKGFRLSFLCSAHLDEIAPWKPVTTVDIRGGDRLIQTAGSAFTIRKEKTDEASRYLKSLKQPKGYAGDNNVLVCKLVPGNSFAHAEYICHKSEAEALPLKPKAESDSSGKKSGVQPEIHKRRPNIEWTEEMEEKLKELYNDGNNDSQIATEMSQLFSLELNGTQIDRQLKKMGLRPPKPGGAKK